MTAAIPAIVAALPTVIGDAQKVISLIVGLVHKSAPAQEALGPGTGPVKFSNVFADVMTELQKAAAAGQIDKTLPSDEMVKAIIQAVVTSLQISGLLGAVATTATPTPAPAAAAPHAAVAATGSAQSVTLSAGQSITITVK